MRNVQTSSSPGGNAHAAASAGPGGPGMMMPGAEQMMSMMQGMMGPKMMHMMGSAAGSLEGGMMPQGGSCAHASAQASAGGEQAQASQGAQQAQGGQQPQEAQGGQQDLMPMEEIMQLLQDNPIGQLLLQSFASTEEGAATLEAMLSSPGGQQTILAFLEGAGQLMEALMNGGSQQQQGGPQARSAQGESGGAQQRSAAREPEGAQRSGQSERGGRSGQAEGQAMDPQEFVDRLAESEEGTELLQLFAATDEGMELLEALVTEESGRGQQAIIGLLQGLHSEADGDPAPAENVIEAVENSDLASALMAVFQAAGPEGEEMVRKLIETAEGQSGLAAYLAAIEG